MRYRRIVSTAIVVVVATTLLSGQVNLEKLKDPAQLTERAPDQYRARFDTSQGVFVIAVERMVLLLDEMEEALSAQRWLAGDAYTLADVAFTPYLARLEHLNILGLIGERHRVADWYSRCKARPSFREAIVKWENADFLALMQVRGAVAWTQVREIVGRSDTAGAPAA